MDLADAVSALGGEIDDLGWRDFDELHELPGKARQYLLQAEAGGFSVPFQQDEALHLIYVVERQEPRPLEYDEAAQTVRADYLERYSQQLFAEVVAGRLEGAGFVFYEEHLRGLLGATD
jgi:hypothetical protein